jgi:hypothetical protein
VDAETLAWLAGLLEGEGTFFLSKNVVKGKLYQYPLIALNMTDADVVDRVSVLFGNKSYKARNKDRKDSFRAVITGQRAVDWMRRVLPYMGMRRARKIQELLDWWAAKPSTKVLRSASCRKAASTRCRNAKGVFV